MLFSKICFFFISEPCYKRSHLLELSDELIRLVLINLDPIDVLAVQATGNQRILHIVRELNHHMLTKFQVALWRMQSSLNFFDTTQFTFVPWPTHIIDLFVFYPIFADKTQFVLNLLTVYCPIAALFQQEPTFQASCYELVDRAYEITMQKLTPNLIVKFVNVAFAALEGLKTMSFTDTVSHPMRYINFSRMVKGLTRKEYPNIMDYVYGLDRIRDRDMIVLKWFERHEQNPDANSFVQQAIDRCRVFKALMKNIKSISLTCISLKYITSGILYRFPNVDKLELELGSAQDLGPIIKYLSTTNQIRNLCIHGKRCSGIEFLDPEIFLPLRKFTKLRKLWFCYCEFLTDGVLRNVLSNVQNVHTLGSLFNISITAQGMVRALAQQQKIHTLDMNYCRIRVTHTPRVPGRRMRKYCCFGVAVLFYILFMSMAVCDPFW